MVFEATAIVWTWLELCPHHLKVHMAEAHVTVWWCGPVESAGDRVWKVIRFEGASPPVPTAGGLM
jgi:hypothetical protein